MSVTIEEIEGVNHTIVWYGKDTRGYVHSYNWVKSLFGFVMIKESYCDDGRDTVIAYALPAIPRHPTAKDSRLLHAYSSQGINVKLEGNKNSIPKIHHAIHNGERVEIAIEKAV